MIGKNLNIFPDTTITLAMAMANEPKKTQILKDTVVAAEMFNTSSFHLKSNEDITIVVEFDAGKEVPTGFVCEENCKLKSQIESIDSVTKTGVIHTVKE